MDQDSVLYSSDRGLQGRAASHTFEAEMNLKLNSNLDYDPNYIELEKQNIRIAFFASLVAFVTCSISMSLSWVLFYRDVRRTYMWQGITEICLILLAVTTLVWSRMSLSTLERGRSPSSFLTLVLFLLNATGFAYCITTSLWLFFHRPLHYDYLVGLKMEPHEWSKVMNPEYTLQEGWDSSDKVFKADIAFLVISGLCFLLVAFTTRTVDWSQFILLRYGLYASLGCIVATSFLILYWTAECKEYEKFMSGYPGQEVRLLWIIAICSIAFAILNGFVNVFRWRRGYLIMLLGAASLLSCAMASTGLVWRHVRQAQIVEQQIGSKSDCAITMSTIHENNLQDWCKQPKYLEKDQKCSKKFMVLRWEYQDELRSLNPVCCLVAKHFYLYPHMCLAYWSTFLFIALQINCLLNLGLCDQEDNLSQTSRLITWADIFGKCSVLLIVLGFGLYFYFRKASHIAFESKADIQRSFDSSQTITIPGYPKVPDSILATTNVERRFNSELPNFSVCYPYSETFLYFPEGEVLNCGHPVLNPNCALRVSIGVNDAKIVLNHTKPQGYFQSFQDLTTARAFFPFCGSAQVKDTVLLVGTAANVVNALRGLLICPDRIYSTQKLLVFADTVQLLTQRLSNGITDQELSKIGSFVPDSSKCGQEFGVSRCPGATACKQAISPTYHMVLRTLKGALFFHDNGLVQTALPRTLTLTVSDEKGIIDVEYSIFDDGIFAIKRLPVYVNNTFMYKLVFEDSAGIFQRKEVDILIDGNANQEYQVGDILLTTKDGTVCGFKDQLCLKNQQLLTGDLVVVALNASSKSASDTPIVKVNIKVFEGHSISGQPIAQSVTDSNGRAVIKGLKYGSYAIVAEHDATDLSITLIDLQEPRMNPQPIALLSKVRDYEARLVGQILASDVDLDMVVEMRTISGAKCEVSPFNKFCPYAAHQFDAISGSGEEVILIKDLSVATYNVFFRVSEPYPTTCPAQKVLDSNAYHFASQLNWQQTPTDTTLLSRMIRTRASFRGSGTVSPLKKAYDNFPKSSFTNLNTKYKIIGTVINKNGISIPQSLSLMESRNYLQKDQEKDRIPKELSATKPLNSFVSSVHQDIVDNLLPEDARLDTITSNVKNFSSSSSGSVDATEVELQAGFSSQREGSVVFKRKMITVIYSNQTVLANSTSERFDKGASTPCYKRVNVTWTHANGAHTHSISDAFSLPTGQGTLTQTVEQSAAPTVTTTNTKITNTSNLADGSTLTNTTSITSVKSTTGTTKTRDWAADTLLTNGSKEAAQNSWREEYTATRPAKTKTVESAKREVKDKNQKLVVTETSQQERTDNWETGEAFVAGFWNWIGFGVLSNGGSLNRKNTTREEILANRSTVLEWKYTQAEFAPDADPRTSSSTATTTKSYKAIKHPNGTVHEYK